MGRAWSIVLVSGCWDLEAPIEAAACQLAATCSVSGWYLDHDQCVDWFDEGVLGCELQGRFSDQTACLRDLELASCEETSTYGHASAETLPWPESCVRACGEEILDLQQIPPPPAPANYCSWSSLSPPERLVLCVAPDKTCTISAESCDPMQVFVWSVEAMTLQAVPPLQSILLLHIPGVRADDQIPVAEGFSEDILLGTEENPNLLWLGTSLSVQGEIGLAVTVRHIAPATE